MAKPISHDERQRIADLLRQGKSRNAVAKEAGRSVSTVAKIGRDEGIEVAEAAHSRLAHAHAARKAYGAEARADRLAKAHQRMDQILDKMGEPHRRYNFGGKENTLNWVDLEEPDSDMLKQYASAYASLARAEADTLRHDQQSGDVDQAAGLIVDLVDSIRGQRD